MKKEGGLCTVKTEPTTPYCGGVAVGC